MSVRSNPQITTKGPGDLMAPPEEEERCPVCGCSMVETESGTWQGHAWANYECSDEDCDGHFDGEPDWESIFNG